MRIVIVALFLIGFSGGVKAQVDYTALIKATQSQDAEGGNLKLAWWIPAEFWEQALLQQGVAGYQAQSFLEILEPYVFVGVIEGEMGDYGTVSYTDESLLRSTLKVTGTSGEVRRPLPTDEIPEELDYLLSILKPMLQGMMGEMGSNFNFYVLSDEMDDGSRFCDPFVEGGVKIECGSSEHSFRTPLGPLLPPKICPVDDEEYMGDYNYCPYHGDKLEDK